MSFTSSTSTTVLASRLSLTTRRVDSSTNTTKSNRGCRKGCFAPPRSSSSVDEARSTKSRTAKGKKTSSSSSGGKKKTGSSSVQRIIHTDKIVSKLNAVLNKDEQKKSSTKTPSGTSTKSYARRKRNRGRRLRRLRNRRKPRADGTGRFISCRTSRARRTRENTWRLNRYRR